MDTSQTSRTGERAGIGSIVGVEDRAGRTSEYELVGPAESTERATVTVDSAVGQALLGARPGDVLQLTLGNGRRRRLRVLDVQRPSGRSAG